MSNQRPGWVFSITLALAVCCAGASSAETETVTYKASQRTTTRHDSRGKRVRVKVAVVEAVITSSEGSRPYPILELMSGWTDRTPGGLVYHSPLDRAEEIADRLGHAAVTKLQWWTDLKEANINGSYVVAIPTELIDKGYVVTAVPEMASALNGSALKGLPGRIIKEIQEVLNGDVRAVLIRSRALNDLEPALWQSKANLERNGAVSWKSRALENQSRADQLRDEARDKCLAEAMTDWMQALSKYVGALEWRGDYIEAHEGLIEAFEAQREIAKSLKQSVPATYELAYNTSKASIESLKRAHEFCANAEDAARAGNWVDAMANYTGAVDAAPSDSPAQLFFAIGLAESAHRLGKAAERDKALSDVKEALYPGGMVNEGGIINATAPSSGHAAIKNLQDRYAASKQM